MTQRSSGAEKRAVRRVAGRRAGLSFLALASALVLATSARAGTDPVDTIQYDLVSGDASIIEPHFEIRVAFHAPTFDPATASFVVFIDADQNPATGAPGVNSLGDDAALLGAEAMLLYNPCDNDLIADLYRWNGSSYFLSSVASAFSRPGATIELRIGGVAISDIYPTGPMNFKVASQKCLGPGSFSGGVDYLPNIGLAPFTTVDHSPPPGPWLTSPDLPGYGTKVRIDGSRMGTAVAKCIDETICVAGALPTRVEVQVRVVGPKPNGFNWPTITRFNTTSAEVWIQEFASEEVRFYFLRGAAGANDELPGLFDRGGFRDNP